MSAATERLRAAPWLTKPETQRLFDLLDGRTGRTRAVGGLVRDTLIGIARHDSDLDLATELLPEEVMVRASDAHIAAYPTGIAHGTVTLRLGTVVAEVTTLREDVRTDGRHAEVAFGTDWRADAMRRDFTMNALYARMDGALFDPLEGLDDCLAGRVRFIGDADRRIAEDRLRVYRFFRFSASHGREQFDPSGLAACARAADTLGQLSAERIGHEMRRLLGLPRAALTLGAMRDCAVLANDILGPECLERLSRYEQLADEPSLAGRLALFASGVGAEALQSAWRLSNSERERANQVLAACELLVSGASGEALYRYPDAVRDAIPVGAAMAGLGIDWVAATARSIDSTSPPQFPVAGRDLIAAGIAAGPELGRKLALLERAWIDSGFTLDRQALLAQLVT
ncbi:MAG TPA: CCA tRNA nucleotidyltransferase [Devosiaceae bacterium]